jgi:tRNA threonylcarbamoyladenosine biosynthesis protein TsaE
MTMRWEMESHSHAETVTCARTLGRLLGPGCVIGLDGDLGAGKTCFVKGLAQGINQTDPDDVTSPTFTILQEYGGRIPLYHFDLYRLAGADDLDGIGFDEYLGGRGIAAIEWAESISGALPRDCLRVRITVVDDLIRRISFIARGAVYADVLERFRHAVEGV